MIKEIRLTSLIATLILLAGCGAKDNTPPPTPLTKMAPNLIKVSQVWRQPVGQGQGKVMLNLGVAKSEGVVAAASYDGVVKLISSNHGKLLWQTRLYYAWSATPVISKNAVVVGSIHGELVALSRATGKVLWHKQLSSSILAQPAVSGNTVVVHTHDGHVAAFNLNTGKQRWLYDGHMPSLTLEGDSAPVISGDDVIVGTHSGAIMTFNLNNGKVLWSRPIAIASGESDVAQMVDVLGTPVVKNGIIYATSYHGNVVALKLSDGQLVWQYELSSFSSPAIADHKVIVVADDGSVLALSQDSGHLLWINKKLKHRFVTSPVVLHGHVIVGDYAGYLHWLSLQNGQLLARWQIDRHGLNSSAIVQHGIVIALGNGGRLVAMKASI